MSLGPLAARARGLATRTLDGTGGTPRLVEARLRDRSERELAVLARWGNNAIAPLELDEDRYTLRAIARGLVAKMPASQRIDGAIATRSLPRRMLGKLASAASFAEVATVLGDHPLAAAFGATDLFDVEAALVRRYVAAARSTDPAFVAYREQLVDVANAVTALLLAARGGDLLREPLFIAGGRLLDHASFLARSGVREMLARRFAKTPLASAVFAPGPAAIEDAALAWQLATQRRFRLLEPLGLAPVLCLVLERRAEGRGVRRTAWRDALGGAA